MAFHGFGISGYRSFREELTVVGPLRQINLIAGVNNVGKSNVLRFAELVLANVKDPSVIREAWIPDLDDPDELGGSVPVLALAVPLTGAGIVEAAERRGLGLSSDVLDGFVSVLRSDAFHARDGLAWVQFRLEGLEGAQPAEFILDPTQISDAMDALQAGHGQRLSELSSALTGTAGGNRGEDLQRVLLSLDLLSHVPSVVHIGPFRQIRKRSGEQPNTSHDGRGLIEVLAAYDRPNGANRRNRRKFDAINRFVQTVLDDPSVRIEVPNDNSTVNVLQGDLLLPVESLGTGLHELVIIATESVVLENALICIEEPEVHLHPTLQRQLLRFLEEETSNQYLIATHSAQLLDAPEALILHATRADLQTRLDVVSNSRQQAQVCADLGYRASDLVQSNAVVWVEGPSDRIYLRRWIELIAPDLIEGVHYSIMFYGGALLKHLSVLDPDDQSVDDFISLRRLNRNSHIMIDSDRSEDGGVLSDSKNRVIAEFGEDSIAWVTAGRTIENYVPEGLLLAAISAVHPKMTPPDLGQYSPPIATGMDKVRIARWVADNWGSAGPGWPFDLAERVRAIAHEIRVANGLTSDAESPQH